METLLKGHLIAFTVAFVLLFGNEMLLTSLYIASILAALAHIFDILKSKFTDYSTFHTRLYTCSKEFDFISWRLFWFQTLQKLCATWLIPAAAMGILLFVIVFLFTERKELVHRSGDRETICQEIFYNVVQTACYAVMALLIMRLKLFFTPHLCICSAFLANNK
ncbi:hypothetical protein OSTOST_18216, partial [Ostertagia ostertagi]